MNRQKIVKVDVDGVLRNLTSAMCSLFNDHFASSEEDMLTSEMLKTYDVDSEERFQVILKEYHQLPSYWFFIEHGEECFRESLSCFGAVNGIKSLKEDGFHIAICTWQMNNDNKCYTLDWLDEQGIEYDSIHFTKDKWTVKGDYMIDDNVEFLYHPFEDTKGKYMIHHPYNEAEVSKAKKMGIRSMHNLRDVAQHIRICEKMTVKAADVAMAFELIG